ncbi:cupin domain-containing protein [Mesorhizobium sp.]|uniref:cupin domain-containing protein n=1 Tax=Mesorhizobium sp. TaxID=1871066 RepID=UPI00338FD8D1
MYARSSNSADPVVHLLGQFLRDLRPAEASYCRAEVTRPWGIGLQFQKGIRFHFVAEGSCWVLIEGSEPERLDQGDVVLLPHGTKHVIADDPESAGPISPSWGQDRYPAQAIRSTPAAGVPDPSFSAAPWISRNRWPID